MKFRPGISGCPERRFKPGHPYRWQPGQSGNPSGKSSLQTEFERALADALAGEKPAERASELAELVWKSARAGEPWAVQMLMQRLAPVPTQIKLTHEVNDNGGFDYTQLNDAEIEELERLLARAAGATPALESGEGETEPPDVH
jgi:hypothetical protein